ncbi:hypothetical protein AGR8A_Cc40596 [Agrobacterium fabrum str. J-07]|nr:hypothetical protein AGR8A_Cc40596 [Agrobacterium fabrum str. J-07]
MGAACFFSPPGRSPRQRDEGASSPDVSAVALHSNLSGHLLPGGEKKLAAMPSTAAAFENGQENEGRKRPFLPKT